MQWLTHALGGKVERAERREYGPAQLDIEGSSALFKGLSAEANGEGVEQPWRSRSVPAGGFRVTGPHR